MPKPLSEILPIIRETEIGLNTDQKNSYLELVNRDIQATPDKSKHMNILLKNYVDIKSKKKELFYKSHYNELMKEGDTPQIAKMISPQFRDALLNIANIDQNIINSYRNWMEKQGVKNVDENKAKEWLLMEILKNPLKSDQLVVGMAKETAKMKPEELEGLEKLYSSQAVKK